MSQKSPVSSTTRATSSSEETAAWYRALTLEERLSQLHDVDTSQVTRPQLASKRLAAWKNEPAFRHTPERFQERLEQAGLDEATLRYLLTEPAEKLAQRHELPAWAAHIEAVYQSESAARFAARETDDAEKQAYLDNSMLAMARYAGPLVNEAANRLNDNLDDLLATYPDEIITLDRQALFGVMVDSMFARVASHSFRAMTLMLNIKRLQGDLEGDSSQERFLNFLETTKQPDVALEFLRTYPVLARQVVNRLEQSVTVHTEFLERLLRDQAEIRSHFFPQMDSLRLVSLDIGAGDRHDNGRSVYLLDFSEGQRLVYKPRNMDIEIQFQELLRWFNNQSIEPALKQIDSLDCGSYGWVEYIQPDACEDEAALKRFYQRQGIYLAILYALRAIDFHYENVIAHGEHPMLVDLETLFHHQNEMPNDPYIFMSRKMMDSVMMIGLLPARIGGGDEKGVDLSGLGGEEGQLTPGKILHPQAAGTDEMRLTHEQAVLPGGDNRPQLAGQSINVLHYADDLIAGFESAYRCILDHRNTFLQDDGLLAQFAHQTIRHIARPTQTYMRYLTESFHPDLLKDALRRQRYFDNLWGKVVLTPMLKKLIPVEMQELIYEGCVPVFRSTPAEASLTSSKGERIPDCFPASSLDLTIERMRRVSEKDLDEQLRMIRGSLTTLSINNAGWINSNTPLPTALTDSAANDTQTDSVQFSADDADFVRVACQIGDRLLETCLMEEQSQSVGWIGPSVTEDSLWMLQPLGIDLYSGLAGVGLFLAYLGEISGETRYTRLAKQIVRTIHTILDELLKDDVTFTQTTNIGAFGELAGTLYLYTHVSVLWDNPDDYEEQVSQIMDLLEASLPEDTNLDIISGAAGCLAALLARYQVYPSERLLTLARQCAEHLLAHAKTLETGSGWENNLSSEPLLGFSHGVAGIAWALMRFYVLTGEDTFRDAALAGFEYEHTMYDEETLNWPDLRDDEMMNKNRMQDAEQDDNQPVIKQDMVAWCHGAPGVGLSRAAVMQLLNSWPEHMEIDLQRALEKTLQRGFPMNHSLCHGELGNLELLIQARQVMDEPALQPLIDELAARVVDNIEHQGWLCGVPLAAETPSLMTGISGIGYGLLRMAFPERIPTVQLLQPPVQATS